MQAGGLSRLLLLVSVLADLECLDLISDDQKMNKNTKKFFDTYVLQSWKTILNLFVKKFDTKGKIIFSIF